MNKISTNLGPGIETNLFQWIIRSRFQSQLRKTQVFTQKIRTEEFKVMYPRRNLCVPSGNQISFFRP